MNHTVLDVIIEYFITDLFTCNYQETTRWQQLQVQI
jgi:hypothetical protein